MAGSSSGSSITTGAPSATASVAVTSRAAACGAIRSRAWKRRPFTASVPFATVPNPPSVPSSCATAALLRSSVPPASMTVFVAGRLAAAARRSVPFETTVSPA